MKGLALLLKPGGKYYQLSFSDAEPPGRGPRRISQQEIHQVFNDASGWKVREGGGGMGWRGAPKVVSLCCPASLPRPIRSYVKHFWRRDGIIALKAGGLERNRKGEAEDG